MSSQSHNPFDLSALFSQFDPQNYWSQMQSTFSAMQLPASINDTLLKAQKKNMDALMEANQATLAGTQELLQRQGELLRLAVMAATETAKPLADAQGAQAVAEKQAELVQFACDKALEISTELSELVKENQAQLTKTLNQRLDEGLNEIKSALGQAT